jgi:hypothetical protein
MQSLLTTCAAVLSSLNNALQLPGKIAEINRSKWFPGIVIGLSLLAVATLTWYAHDWLAGTPTAVASVSVPTHQASVSSSASTVAPLPPLTPPARQTATAPASHHRRTVAKNTPRPSEAGSPQSAQVEPATTASPAQAQPADNCIGRNTFKNVQIHGKYAVGLTTLCNDFEGGTIDGEETGVTVSIPLDEQTGKPIYMGVFPPAAVSSVPSRPQR